MHRRADRRKLLSVVAEGHTSPDLEMMKVFVLTPGLGGDCSCTMQQSEFGIANVIMYLRCC